MPVYQYYSIDVSGKKRHGLIEAQSEKDAKDKLRQQGEMVTKLSSKAKTSSRNNLKDELLVTFTLQLSQLVNAGVPLYESLLAIEEQYRNEPYHRIILSLCDQIKAGTSLSEAMAYYPDSFNKLYRSMIAAGEASGTIGMVLERLTQLLKRQYKIKKQVTTAMIYPGILAGFSLLIVFLLLGFVVPSIEGIFEGKELNAYTAFVIQASHIFRDYWWLYFPIFGFSIAYMIVKLRSQKGQLWLQRHLLKIPVIKTLLIQTSIARFSRTLATMQQGGLPLIDSLRIARDVMHNVVLEEEVQKAEAKIIEGSSLSAELAHSPWFPSVVSRMLAVGEDAGSSVNMLNKIADMYEEELEKTIDRLMALSQPAILIFMGAIIGLVLMAILLPLTDTTAFKI